MKCGSCKDCRENLHVVFDTNFLLIPVENKVDVFDQIRRKLGKLVFVVPGPVLKELELKAKHENKFKIALELLGHQDFQVVESGYGADDSVISVARELRAYVATMDGKLRERVRDSYLKLITLRGKDKIEAE